MSLKIYHNPRCSKSRQALAILTQADADFEIIEYLKTGLDVETLKNLHGQLNAPVRAMMRSGEAVYKELGLKNIDDEAALLQAMADNPILLERPLLSDGKKALVCRPPELATEFLS